MEVSKPLTVVTIGCGQRGQIYSQYSLENPNLLKVVAICEPRVEIQNLMKQKYNLEQEHIFNSYTDLQQFAKPIADIAFICIQDQSHKEATLICSNLGYKHILLEKPMAVTYEDCQEIANVCKQNNTSLTVCHVLRYTPWNRQIKKIIQDGIIGEVVNIQHSESIGF